MRQMERMKNRRLPEEKWKKPRMESGKWAGDERQKERESPAFCWRTVLDSLKEIREKRGK